MIETESKIEGGRERECVKNISREGNRIERAKYKEKLNTDLLYVFVWVLS